MLSSKNLILKYFGNLRCFLVEHSLSLNIYMENGRGEDALCKKRAV